MTDILLQIGATKLALAVVLAGVVWVVTRRVARPAVAHSMWLLVLGAMLVPAVVPLRVLPGEAVVEVVAQPEVVVQPVVVPVRVLPEEVAVDVVTESGAGPPVTVTDAGVTGDGMAPEGWLKENGKPLAALLWILGSAGFFGWTLVRTVRFQRTLTKVARPAPQLQRLGTEIGKTLGLQRAPRFYTTGARLRPLVWWAGGRVRVVIPSMFLAELDETELRAVLAHELAHVRRRDYLVRVVELLACSGYWWNPVVWWARRQMRSAEESSCDMLAVSASRLTRDRYAESLLRVVEVMSAAPIPRAPALASAAESCRDSKLLEKRLMAVLTSALPASSTNGRLRVAGAPALAFGLSLGLVYCTTGERMAFDQPQLPTPAMSEDSAGIRIVEYAGAPDMQAPFRLSAEPRYRHGGNPGDYPFRYVYAGALLADGRVVVSDAINNALIVLSSDGTTHEVLASGGEDRRPYYFSDVFALGRDSILVTHHTLSRVTIFAGGSVARTVDTGNADGLALQGIGSSGELLLATGGFYSGFEEEWLPGHLARMDPQTSTVDTVASYDFMPYNPRTYYNPFVGFGHVTVAGGQFVYTRSDRPEVTWRRPDGTIRQIVRWQPEWAYATEEHLRPHQVRLRDHHRRADPGASRATIEERVKEDMAATDVRVGYPLPLFRFPVGDSEGRVWLPKNVTGGPMHGSPPFTVLAWDGEWLGTVDAPLGIYVLDATEGLVLGVQSDDTRVGNVVVVYELIER